MIRGMSAVKRPPFPPFTEEDAWEKVLGYVLRKDLWAFAGGNENWEFEDNGLMRRREASINDVSIAETDRRIDGPVAEGAGAGIPLR